MTLLRKKKKKNVVWSFRQTLSPTSTQRSSEANDPVSFLSSSLSFFFSLVLFTVRPMCTYYLFRCGFVKTAVRTLKKKSRYYKNSRNLKGTQRSTTPVKVAMAVSGLNVTLSGVWLKPEPQLEVLSRTGWRAKRRHYNRIVAYDCCLYRRSQQINAYK